jgi:hypothetical protein
VIFVFALVFVAGSGVLGWMAYKQHLRAEVMAATATVRCGDAIAGRCEVVGQAQPGAAGTISAPFSGVTCVWRRSTVTEHYWETEWRGTGSNRRRQRVRKTRQISDERSAHPFHIDDGSGQVGVHPQDAHVDAPQQVFDRFRHAGPDAGGWDLSIGPIQLGGGDRTIGWAYEEWVIWPGQRLYALGEAESLGGFVVLRRPPDGELVVSTRSEAELSSATRRNMYLLGAGSAVAAAVALVLVMRWRIALVVLLLGVAGAKPASADLATGSVTDPDDVDIALDMATASLTDDEGTVTLTVTTHDAFADEEIAFFWLLQTRSDDSPDAFVSAQYNQDSQEVEAFLFADPGGTVTLTRLSETSLRAVFAKNALGQVEELSFFVLSGNDSEGDQAPDTFDNAVFRLAGEDRIDTALAAWSNRETETVVLARSDEYADALAGVPLAAANEAPILLTAPGALDQRVRDAMHAQLVPGGRVFLLGGPQALSPAVEDAVRSDGYEVIRVSGADRYETSVDIARAAVGSPATIFLTRGDDFPDALPAGPAAAATGGVVVLTAGGDLPGSVRAYLDEHGAAERFAVGGSAAAADPSATPIVGGDRYDTAVRVAERFFAAASAIAVVSGERFPDALPAGALAVSEDPPAPLLLTQPAALAPVVRDYASARASQLEVAVVFGGALAMSDAALDDLEEAIL